MFTQSDGESPHISNSSSCDIKEEMKISNESPLTTDAPKRTHEGYNPGLMLSKEEMRELEKIIRKKQS